MTLFFTLAPSVLIVLFVVVQAYLAGVNAFPHPPRSQFQTAEVVKRSSLGTRTPGGFELPITRVVRENLSKRGDLSDEIGLGNNADLLYTVPIEIGGTVAAVNLDTGSSDLWIVTDSCTTNTCQGSTVTRYPSSSLNPVGTNVTMLYGDSTSGTFASGPVARDVATIAGIAMEDQKFAAVQETNSQIVAFGTSGIFGLGFPSGSKIQEAIVTSQLGPIDATDDFVSATVSDGPLLSRIVTSNALKEPMFSITLQRNTIDIGGNGMLSVGALPSGIDESALTWVPVRRYPVNVGGLQAPSFAPDEIYPFRWEIDVEGVFLDGQRLPDSTIPTGDEDVDSLRVSALIDTGNSLIRGPKDVVDGVLSSISSTYNPSAARPVAQVPCSVPRSLAFQIGGQMFPVDPRDMIGEQREGDTSTCVADNLVSTDAPSVGATFRWNLGAPFMRSNLVAFHYGNLTHPSVDPPRIGLMSLVPENVDDLFRQVIVDAQQTGDFEQTLQIAPTEIAAAEGQVTVTAAPQPTGLGSSRGNSSLSNGNGNDPASDFASASAHIPWFSTLVGTWIVLCSILL